VPFGLIVVAQAGHAHKTTHRSAGIVSAAAWPQAGQVIVTNSSAMLSL
jgi:hypothetical protein